MRQRRCRQSDSGIRCGSACRLVYRDFLRFVCVCVFVSGSATSLRAIMPLTGRISCVFVFVFVVIYPFVCNHACSCVFMSTLALCASVFVCFYMRVCDTLGHVALHRAAGRVAGPAADVLQVHVRRSVSMIGRSGGRRIAFR
jgi:hypothetical protein